MVFAFMDDTMFLPDTWAEDLENAKRITRKQDFRLRRSAERRSQQQAHQRQHRQGRTNG